MDLMRTFRFEAAHRLPRVPVTHKCHRLHGHSFFLEVTVTGDPQEATGWVMDFGEISRRCDPVVSRLDHNYLNEIEGLENPTSENIVRWLWRELYGELPGLSAITLSETCTSRCTYRGP
jgi:6-pyruvoyltetrahydropterin/6-carboxytetrahydropterin synthase